MAQYNPYSRYLNPQRYIYKPPRLTPPRVGTSLLGLASRYGVEGPQYSFDEPQEDLRLPQEGERSPSYATQQPDTRLPLLQPYSAADTPQVKPFEPNPANSLATVLGSAASAIDPYGLGGRLGSAAANVAQYNNQLDAMKYVAAGYVRGRGGVGGRGAATEVPYFDEATGQWHMVQVEPGTNRMLYARPMTPAELQATERQPYKLQGFDSNKNLYGPLFTDKEGKPLAPVEPLYKAQPSDIVIETPYGTFTKGQLDARGGFIPAPHNVAPGATGFNIPGQAGPVVAQPTLDQSTISLAPGHQALTQKYFESQTGPITAPLTPQQRSIAPGHTVPRAGLLENNVIDYTAPLTPQQLAKEAAAEKPVGFDAGQPVWVAGKGGKPGHWEFAPGTPQDKEFKPTGEETLAKDFITQFESLQDIPAGKGIFGGSAQSAEDQAKVLIKKEADPETKRAMRRAYTEVFIRRGKKPTQGKPSSAQQEADRILQKLGK